MKPGPGARVVGYRPVTGRPTNPDGTLRLVFEYERTLSGKRADFVIVDEPPVKPVRRIVRGAYHASDESPSSAPPQGSLI